jgi:adenosylcobyric acid synthase
VILPGSKQTLRDLEALTNSGLGDQLRSYNRAGGSVLGICGGMQMLGQTLIDPEGLEGMDQMGPQRGLGLLPLVTTFSGTKSLRQRTIQSLWPIGTQLTGFELHYGTTAPGPGLEPLSSDPGLGWWALGPKESSVVGTYLHGLLDNGPWRRAWLNSLRRQRGLQPLPNEPKNHSAHRDLLLDRLADAFEQHVNLAPLLQP